MNNSIPLIPIQETENSTPENSIIVDATRNNPAVRLAKGRYQRWRRALAGPLVMVFLLAPWLTLNDAPWLWMNLDTRQLHLLGMTFWPDDLLMLTWLALASAFALFTVATMSGRLWCGFACPQTVWSMMFIWVEETLQGGRHQRLKDQNKPWRERRWLRIGLKHLAWAAIALITGFTFVAFFETGPELFNDLITAQASIEVYFWILFFSSLTYLNGGWLREQVCLHMCPYARFQSVMLDNKSLKVSYDTQRGEPRKQQGDCVDCSLCVQVCPVGIDIRQGLQYACIDCAACIDACDEVMEKIHKPKGLIRFAYDINVPLKWRQLLTKRSKLWGYATLTLLSICAFVIQILMSETLDAHLSRDRSQLYYYSQDGSLTNAYTLKLQNKTREFQAYQFNLMPEELKLTTMTKVSLDAGESKLITLEIHCPEPCGLTRTTDIQLDIKNSKTRELTRLTNRYFVPR